MVFYVTKCVDQFDKPAKILLLPTVSTISSWNVVVGFGNSNTCPPFLLRTTTSRSGWESLSSTVKSGWKWRWLLCPPSMPFVSLRPFAHPPPPPHPTPVLPSFLPLSPIEKHRGGWVDDGSRRRVGWQRQRRRRRRRRDHNREREEKEKMMTSALAMDTGCCLLCT